MKWLKFDYKIGDRRQKKKFAFFPITIEEPGKRETRWLETVVIEQEYTEGIVYYTLEPYDSGEPHFFWKNLRFVN